MSISIPSEEASKSVQVAVKFLVAPRSQYWLARMICSGSILITAMIAYFSPVSLQRTVLQEVGTPGWILIVAIVALASFCFIETIVNDLMADCFRMEWSDEHRHQIYMGLCLLLAWLIWLNFRHDANWLLIFRYGFDCLACLAVAVFDTVSRFRKVQQLRAAASQG